MIFFQDIAKYIPALVIISIAISCYVPCQATSCLIGAQGNPYCRTLLGCTVVVLRDDCESLAMAERLLGAFITQRTTLPGIANALMTDHAQAAIVPCESVEALKSYLFCENSRVLILS